MSRSGRDPDSNWLARYHGSDHIKALRSGQHGRAATPGRAAPEARTWLPRRLQ